MPLNLFLHCDRCDFAEDVIVGGDQPFGPWYHWRSGYPWAKHDIELIETWRSISFGDSVVCVFCYREDFLGQKEIA